MKKRRLYAALGCLLFMLLLSQPALALQNNYYVVDGDDTRISTPVPYTPDRNVNYFGEYGGLKNPMGIFIDQNDCIYVADTGNNRILKLDSQMKVVKEYVGEGKTALNAPQGVFVYQNGDIFIADTGNQRILHITQEGKYVEELIKPESNLIADNVTFNPSKIAVSPTGLVYMIKGEHFMLLDAYNNFQGYVGATQVGFDLTQWFIRQFASQEQIDQLKKQEPKPYANFCLADDGFVYAIAMGESGQIRKINAVGTNVFEEKVYGEKYVDDKDEQVISQFIDIAVDDNNIISVLASDNGRIYQYDSEGNMLCSFGGLGNINGLFSNPVALDTDSNSNIYVLDTAANSVQKFSPTHFIQTVHMANVLYNDGKYLESSQYWQEVLNIDASYDLAHSGMAKALYKESKYKESMKEYDLANNRAGYSKAFSKYRHDLFRNNFVALVLIGAAVIAVAILLIVLFLRLNRRIYNELILRIRK